MEYSAAGERLNHIDVKSQSVVAQVNNGFNANS